MAYIRERRLHFNPKQEFVQAFLASCDSVRSSKKGETHFDFDGQILGTLRTGPEEDPG